MYYVNKIVGWALSPLGILFIGLLLGWLAGRRFRRLGRVVIALALVQAWVLACGVTTRFIGVPLEGEEESIEQVKARVEAANVGVIVLLGGGMGTHERCGHPEMYSGADRVWLAAKIWKPGRLLTASGGGMAGEVALLGDLGVDTNCVARLEDPRNTEEEATFIMRLIKTTDRPASFKIALVTSAWHMPRAKMIFERAGFEVVEAPTDFEMHAVAEEKLAFGDFFPSGEALTRNSYAVKEWIARVGYAARYAIKSKLRR